MSYTSSKRHRGLTLSVYWTDGRWALNVAISSLTGPDHGTFHVGCTVLGEDAGIPSVEDLLATAVAALGKVQRERGRPAGRPITAGARVDRWHTSGVPSGDHRGGRARWS